MPNRYQFLAGGTPEGTDLPGGSEESIAATHRVVIGLESKFSSQPAPENAMNQPCKRTAWNSGKLVGQKAPLKLKEIWAIRFRLQLAGDIRKLALFDLAIDSKLRACDLVGLHVRDVTHGAQIAPRARVIQRKTKRPVQFEISPPDPR